MYDLWDPWKVYGKSFAEGQLVCNQNFLNPNKLPLGKASMKVKAKFSELKHIRANDYELWATGAVGTCNPSQLVFVYGYYSIIFVIAANIYYEYEGWVSQLSVFLA